MSTPQNQLKPPAQPDALDALLATVPPAGGRRGARATSPRTAQPRPAAPAPPPVDPRLDSFIANVMDDATRASGFTYKFGSGSRTPAEQAEKVAQGYSRTYNSPHLAGRGRDVEAFDERGNYIADGAHPAYQALGAAYRQRANELPVKWGGDFKTFHDPGHFELADEQPDALDQVLAGVPAAGGGGDALDRLLADVPAKPQMPGVSVVRSGNEQAGAGEFWWVDEQGNKVRRVVAGDEVPAVPEIDPVEVERVGASVPRDSRPGDALANVSDEELINLWARQTGDNEEARGLARNFLSANGRGALVEHMQRNGLLPPAPSATRPRRAPAFDPQTEAGRAERDAQTAAAAHPDARVTLDLSLPKGVGGWDEVTSNHLARIAAGQYAQTHGIPDEFVSQWLARHGHELKAYDLQTGAPLDGVDAIGRKGVYDSQRRTVRVSAEMPHLLQLQHDYEQWRSVAQHAADWVSDPTRSAGEKFLDVVTPAAHGVAKVVDYAARPFNAVDAQFWSRVNRRGAANKLAAIGNPFDPEAMHAAYSAFTGETRPGAENPLAEYVRNMPAGSVGAEHPGLTAATAGAVELLTSPSNALLPAGGEALRAARGTRLAAAVGLGAESAGEAERFARGGRVLGLADAPAASAASAAGRGARALDTALDVLNVPRSLVTTADLSAAGRQGLILSLTEPKAALRAMGRQVRSFVSQGSHDDLLRWLATHPDADLAEHSGLYSAMKQQAGLSGREEAFMSRLAGRLPVVKQSERAYVAYLDVLRQESFSRYARELERAGYNAIDHPDEFKSIARFINSATGRGELPAALEKVAPVLNATLFAPRNLKGRFDVLNPVFYAQMSPAARKIAVRKMVQFSSTVLSGMYLAYLAGAKVTLNPDDPDFGKVVVGRTRYDFSGGHRSVVRVVARLGKTFAGARGGDLKSVSAKAGKILFGFARQNLAPVPGYAAAAATGKEISGEQFERVGHLRRNGRLDPGGGVVARVVPLAVQDVFDAWAEEGGRGVAKAAPAALFGVGVQSYEPRQRARRAGTR